MKIQIRRSTVEISQCLQTLGPSRSDNLCSYVDEVDIGDIGEHYYHEGTCLQFWQGGCEAFYEMLGFPSGFNNFQKKISSVRFEYD